MKDSTIKGALIIIMVNIACWFIPLRVRLAIYEVLSNLPDAPKKATEVKYHEVKKIEPKQPELKKTKTDILVEEDKLDEWLKTNPDLLRANKN